MRSQSQMNQETGHTGAWYLPRQPIEGVQGRLTGGDGVARQFGLDNTLAPTARSIHQSIVKPTRAPRLVVIMISPEPTTEPTRIDAGTDEAQGLNDARGRFPHPLGVPRVRNGRLAGVRRRRSRGGCHRCVPSDSANTPAAVSNPSQPAGKPA